jgi:hypothetical protein
MHSLLNFNPFLPFGLVHFPDLHEDFLTSGKLLWAAFQKSSVQIRVSTYRKNETALFRRVFKLAVLGVQWR